MILKDLLTAYGPAGAVGFVLIVVATILLSGKNPLDFSQLADLSAKQATGLAFMVIGLVLLTWRIVQRKHEGQLDEGDASILRTKVLSPLNRRAINEHKHEREHLRAQLCALRETRIALQKAEPEFSSQAVRAVVSSIVQILGGIEEMSPWKNDVGVQAGSSNIVENRKEFNAFCLNIESIAHGSTAVFGRRKPVPQPRDGDYYGSMLMLVEDRLIAIRILCEELQRLADHRPL